MPENTGGDERSAETDLTIQFTVRKRNGRPHETWQIINSDGTRSEHQGLWDIGALLSSEAANVAFLDEKDRSGPVNHRIRIWSTTAMGLYNQANNAGRPTDFDIHVAWPVSPQGWGTPVCDSRDRND